jgi:hypothetical protein
MTDLTLERLVAARENFFRRWHSEESERIFLTNESRMLEAFDRSNISTSIFRLMTMPLSDPVVVAPTQAQMNTGLISINTSAGSCAICQDGYTPNGEAYRLRNCGHVFHRGCARSWYSRSVYCPLCRNDIRVTSQPNTNE